MRVVTLEYHDVIDDGGFNASGFPGRAASSYKLSAESFDAHLEALAGQPVAVGRDVRDLRFPPPRPTVLLSFDDGGSSALRVIAERLERRGWLGHFFVTTGRIGTAGFLTAPEIRVLRERGHVIGSHSQDHPIRMSALAPAAQHEQWRQSRRRLEDILGGPVDIASVPGGYFDHRVSRVAAEAGIRWLFTSEPVISVFQVEACTVLGRFTLRRSSSAAMARALVGPFPAARLGQWISWNARKLLKRTGGGIYLRVRAAMLGDRPAE